MPDCSEADGLLRASGALVDTEQRDVILERTEGLGGGALPRGPRDLMSDLASTRGAQLLVGVQVLERDCPERPRLGP
jgi:hypothetical protein